MGADRELRDELERVQAENRRLRARVAELEVLEDLVGRVEELETRNVVLKQRLERADRVRESWDQKATRLQRELEHARRERDLLRRQLTRTVRVRKVARRAR